MDALSLVNGLRCELLLQAQILLLQVICLVVTNHFLLDLLYYCLLLLLFLKVFMGLLQLEPVKLIRQLDIVLPFIIFLDEVAANEDDGLYEAANVREELIDFAELSRVDDRVGASPQVEFR